VARTALLSCAARKGAAIKGGKKLDDFLIDKSARKGRKSADRSADPCAIPVARNSAADTS
jgi:hypothetical protein